MRIYLFPPSLLHKVEDFAIIALPKTALDSPIAPCILYVDMQ